MAFPDVHWEWRGHMCSRMGPGEGLEEEPQEAPWEQA